jgi:EAL and modified HD-GYP domain-containing signal transduction protein
MASKIHDSETRTERVLLSRQPIYHADMTVLGYELLFRNGGGEVAAVKDGAHATATVIVNGLMEIGLDEMVGRNLAFINFERKLLLDNYCESLPHNRVVIEILEDIEPDAQVLKRLEQLRVKGYQIALDDFVCTDAYAPLLQFANFVKLDLLATDWTTIDRALGTIGKYPVQLIAEKVETREQVEMAKEKGFSYFQGYFFCRPQNVSGKQLPVTRLSTIRLLTQLNKPDIKIEELERTISQDVALSYKLLRYINSAMCSLDRHVESIRHATVLVGLERMRTWANLIVFSRFEDTPHEVLVTGALRARMCELIATSLRLPYPERYFLVGLFSVLDAILGRPMAEVVPALALTDELNGALLHHQGELGNVLHCVQAYERREWSDVKAGVALDSELIEKAYLESLVWSAGVLGLSRRITT